MQDTQQTSPTMSGKDNEDEEKEDIPLDAGDIALLQTYVREPGMLGLAIFSFVFQISSNGTLTAGTLLLTLRVSHLGCI